MPGRQRLCAVAAARLHGRAARVTGIAGAGKPLVPGAIGGCRCADAGGASFLIAAANDSRG
jgi:hypothetical protein